MQTDLSGMFKAEYTVNPCIYINIGCICYINTANIFLIWSAIMRINTEGNFLVRKLGPSLKVLMYF